MGAIKHISKGEKYGKGRINKMVNLALTGIYIVFLGLGLYGCSHQTPVASTPENHRNRHFMSALEALTTSQC
jgi:hypothetical protein